MSTLAPPDPSTLAGSVRPGSWSIEWRGMRFAESDLTGQHLSVLSLIVGTDDFAELDVDPRKGHQRLMTMIAAVTAVKAVEAAGDLSEDAVALLVARCIETVAAAPAEEILGAITFG